VAARKGTVFSGMRARADLNPEHFPHPSLREQRTRIGGGVARKYRRACANE